MNLLRQQAEDRRKMLGDAAGRFRVDWGKERAGFDRRIKQSKAMGDRIRAEDLAYRAKALTELKKISTLLSQLTRRTAPK